MKEINIPITMTSKGTFTLPARIRKDFGLNKKGDRIMLRYKPGSRKAELQAPLDIRAMQAEIAKLIPDHLKDKPFDLDQMRRDKHEAYIRDNLA